MSFRNSAAAALPSRSIKYARPRNGSAQRIPWRRVHTDSPPGAVRSPFLDHCNATQQPLGSLAAHNVVLPYPPEICCLADRLKQHAALTIQTSPEIAQKLIDAIDAMSPPNAAPNYWLPTSSCVNSCTDLLNLASGLQNLRRCRAPHGSYMGTC